MNKSDLFPIIARRHGLSQTDAEQVVNTVFKEISDTLAAGNRVELRGFGTFSVRSRQARIGRNPRTGATVSVEPKNVPFFKASKLLRSNVTKDKK